MRSTALKLIGSIALLGATTLPVSAAPVTLHYTGDNDVVAWWVVSFHGQATLSAADIVQSNTVSKGTEWWDTGSASFDLDPGRYGVFFEVRNTDGNPNGFGGTDTPPTSPSPNGNPNPGAFIASIGGVTGAGFYTTYTTWPGWSFIDTTSLSATGSNENDLVDTYNNHPATDALFVFGPNGTGPWGSFPLIDTNAQFIWGNKDGKQGSISNQSTRGIFYTFVDVPVPVPAAAWLLGSAVLGLAGFGRKKSLPM